MHRSDVADVCASLAQQKPFVRCQPAPGEMPFTSFNGKYSLNRKGLISCWLSARCGCSTYHDINTCQHCRVLLFAPWLLVFHTEQKKNRTESQRSSMSVLVQPSPSLYRLMGRATPTTKLLSAIFASFAAGKEK